MRGMTSRVFQTGQYLHAIKAENGVFPWVSYVWNICNVNKYVDWILTLRELLEN